LREAGIVARENLMGLGLANVESLTTGILSRKETARLVEIQTALDRLAVEINQANLTPINPAKLAATFPAGELPTEEAFAAVVAGAGEQRDAVRQVVPAFAEQPRGRGGACLQHELKRRRACVDGAAIARG
jgi:hypothetical protein